MYAGKEMHCETTCIFNYTFLLALLKAATMVQLPRSFPIHGYITVLLITSIIYYLLEYFQNHLQQIYFQEVIKNGLEVTCVLDFLPAMTVLLDFLPAITTVINSTQEAGFRP